MATNPETCCMQFCNRTSCQQLHNTQLHYGKVFIWPAWAMVRLEVTVHPVLNNGDAAARPGRCRRRQMQQGTFLGACIVCLRVLYGLVTAPEGVRHHSVTALLVYTCAAAMRVIMPGRPSRRIWRELISANLLCIRLIDMFQAGLHLPYACWPGASLADAEVS